MSGEQPRRLESLPVHPDSSQGSTWRCLRVEGLVSHPLSLDSGDLEALRRQRLAEDFRCEEGWVVPDQEWEGAPLSTVLALAGPLPSARYASIQAGDYTVSLPLTEMEDLYVVLASHLNGVPLPAEHGGPCRLIASGKKCHYSVKWVDRIELTATPPEETALEILRSCRGSSAT